MAVFTDPDAFVRRVASYGKHIQEREHLATTAAAKVTAESIKAAGARFHIRGRSGKKATLGATAHPTMKVGGTTAALVEAVPQGFWHLVEGGAKGHWIVPRGVTQGRKQRKGARGRQALLGAGYGHPINRPVFHPAIGPIGHPWEAGVAVAAVAAPRAFNAVILTAFTRV